VPEFPSLYEEDSLKVQERVRGTMGERHVPRPSGPDAAYSLENEILIPASVLAPDELSRNTSLI